MNSNGHQTMDEEAAVSIAAMSKEFMDSSRSSDNNNTVDYRTTGEREIRLLRAQATNNQQQSQNNTMSRVISYEKENQHNSVHTAAVDQQQPNNASKSPTSRGLFRNGPGSEPSAVNGICLRQLCILVPPSPVTTNW